MKKRVEGYYVVKGQKCPFSVTLDIKSNKYCIQELIKFHFNTLNMNFGKIYILSAIIIKND
jgi:hypothetical protein